MGRRTKPGRVARRPSAGALAAVAAIALAVVGLALFASPGQTKQTDRYVALGDSYAVGTGASSTRDGYVRRFGAWLARRGVNDVANVAVGGETTTSLVEGGQLDRGLDAIDDGGSTTRAVTIDIGVNELLAPGCKDGVTGPECPARADLEEIFGQVRSALDAEAPGGRLYVVGLFTPFPSAPAPAREALDFLLQGSDGRVDCAGTGAAIGMNDLLACLGAKVGATYVSTSGAFREGGADLVAEDGLHPSDRGHALIAELLERAVDHPTPVRNAGALR